MKACWGCKYLEHQDAKNFDGYPTEVLYCTKHAVFRGYIGRIFEGVIRPEPYMGKECYEV